MPTQKLEEHELVMMTIRSHDQFNTTIYGLNDRYRGIFNERRVVFMNKGDIIGQGFHAGQVVDIYNHYGGNTRVAHKFIIVPYDIPKGNMATYFPEANALVPIDMTAKKSNTPAYKSVVVKIKPSKK